MNHVSFVGEEAFSGSGIKNLNIPSAVKTIEKDAFSGVKKIAAKVADDLQLVKDTATAIAANIIKLFFILF